MNTYRRLHRWGAVLAAVPLLIIICTGVLLQLKKSSSWIQPPTCDGAGGRMRLGFDDILAAARGAGAGIDGWEGVDRLDVRPREGIVKVRGRNGWEVQIDVANGRVLQVAERRSDWLESLHDGSFFGVKMIVFLPVAFVLLGLWATGVYLWWQPFRARRRRKNRVAAPEARC